MQSFPSAPSEVGALLYRSFQYTGQVWLPELGIYYYKARMYDPRLGRFLQTDPMGYKADLDVYVYAANDPLNMNDVSGQFALPVHFLITLAAGLSSDHGWHSFQIAWDAMVRDFGTQHATIEEVAIHAMRIPGESVGTARENSQALIASELAQGHLGNAAHTIEDQFAYAHEGYQIWDGTYGGFTKWLTHELTDLFPTPGRVRAAYDEARDKMTGVEGESEHSTSGENEVRLRESVYHLRVTRIHSRATPMTVTPALPYSKCVTGRLRKIRQTQLVDNATVIRVLRAFVVLAVMGETLGFASNSSVVDRPAIEVVEATIRAHAIIGFSWIDQPLNKIVLIRTRDDLCAIKYLAFSKGREQRSEDGPFYAEAELYSRSTGTVRRLHLSQLPFRGFHPFVFGGGKPYFPCGHERLIWRYPTGTFISPGSDVSLASTRLEDFSQIDFQDPSLQWFRYEEGRTISVR